MVQTSVYQTKPFARLACGLSSTQITWFGASGQKYQAWNSHYLEKAPLTHHLPLTQPGAAASLLFSRSVAQSCLALCDPMDCSTPGFSFLHYLPEFAQTHIY